MQAIEQAALSDSLHIRFGHHLFAQNDFEGAFSQFALCSYANPTILLRLFPSLVSEAMLQSLLPSLEGAPLLHMQDHPKCKCLMGCRLEPLHDISLACVFTLSRTTAAELHGYWHAHAASNSRNSAIVCHSCRYIENSLVHVHLHVADACMPH